MAPKAQSEPPACSKVPKGHYTVQARDARALDRAHALQEVRDAVAIAYCHERNVGAKAKAAIATGLYPQATRHKVTTALQKGASREKAPRDANRQILTTNEECMLNAETGAMNPCLR